MRTSKVACAASDRFQSDRTDSEGALLHLRGANQVSVEKNSSEREEPDTAAAARPRQQTWQPTANCVNVSVFQGASRYDANYTCESHEIDVLHKPCVYDTLILSLMGTEAQFTSRQYAGGFSLTVRSFVFSCVLHLDG